jgi:UPF0755 protein
MKRPLRAAAIGLLTATLLLGLGFLEFRVRDLSPYGPRELVVERGTRAISVLERAGPNSLAPSWLLWCFARLQFGSLGIKAGVYDLAPGGSLHDLLRAMQRDSGRKLYWQAIEGQNLSQLRQSLAELPYLRRESANLSDAVLLERLREQGEGDLAGVRGARDAGLNTTEFGHKLDYLEGLFYPDSYRYVPGMSDVELLAAARKRQLLLLAEVWSRRPMDYPLHSAGELLTLASLIEKETGRAEDRQRVAAVFLNRIRLGMRLQSDPTVIYGRINRDPLAPVTRSDLQLDHPFNTYTRYGLPPTPIAIPGKAALEAAIDPTMERSLYFVARGDGSSEFSETLQAHNAAVQRYLRGPQRNTLEAGRRS